MSEVELHRPLDLREELAEVPLALGHQLLEPLAPSPRLVRQRQQRVVLPVELDLLKRNELAWLTFTRTNYIVKKIWVLHRHPEVQK